MKKLLLLLAACAALPCMAQTVKADEEINDAVTPLHLLKPDYVTPYAQLTPAEIKAVVDRVFNYIDAVTPAKILDKDGREVTDFRKPLPQGCHLNQGTYRLTSYEWGVMYDALLDAAKITGDKRYADYVASRLGLLAQAAPAFKNIYDADGQMRMVCNPVTLDDAGAMSAAWMRAQMAFPQLKLQDVIERYWHIVETAPILLYDGTVARNRPHYSSVWLDDMFMALPSLATRAQYKNDPAQLDRAAGIALGFLKRMWMPEKKLFRHGYVEGMAHEPAMTWGRANGWGILTLAQLLDALPEKHPARPQLLSVFRQHAEGLAATQGINGFWHQLLDRPETYEETSATAIFAYALAHGINQGWLDAETYGPVAQLAWEATASKVNKKGEVEGVCVGTGMGFEPQYYAYRPVSVKAAHGYGLVIWAGAEMIRLVGQQHARLNDSAIHYYRQDPGDTTGEPIFFLDAQGKAQSVRH